MSVPLVATIATFTQTVPIQKVRTTVIVIRDTQEMESRV